MSTIRTAAGVVVGAAVTVGGLYWLFSRLGGGEGDGFGLGLGGSGKGDKLFKKGGVGVSDEPGGTGGDSPDPGGTGDGDGDGDSGKPTQGGGGGTKPTDKPGTGGSKPQGQGQGGGSKPDGQGTGGKGGGIGGGSGGGIGKGDGAGSTGDAGTGGDTGDDDGGGDNQNPTQPYTGWGELMITEDLDPPDLSAAKIEKVRETVYTLVFETVYSTNLPPPLHEFNPNLGIDLVFWADVALHMNYTLPWGRLDPDNATHKPWIDLWVDILQEVVIAENLLNQDANEDLDDSDLEASAAPASPHYGVAYHGANTPRHRRGLWHAERRMRVLRGEGPHQALRRFLGLAS